jgi:hypothetical protein
VDVVETVRMYLAICMPRKKKKTIIFEYIYLNILANVLLSVHLTPWRHFLRTIDGDLQLQSHNIISSTVQSPANC